jgi:membrane protease YdiL (CAAX protease family)
VTRRSIAGVLVFLLARGVILAVAAAILIPAQAGIYLNVVIVGLDIATIAALVLVLRRTGGSIRGLMGRFNGRRDPPLAGLTMFTLFVGLTVGTFAGYAIVYAGPPPPQELGGSVPLWLGLWSLLIMPITVALAEELLYRGWAHERLMMVWRPWVVITVIAVAFGLQHAPLSATSPGEAVARVIATGLAGAALGALRYRRVSLWALVIGHWAFDVIGLRLPMLTRALA